jgi:hypothetical protein
MNRKRRFILWKRNEMKKKKKKRKEKNEKKRMNGGKEGMVRKGDGKKERKEC